MQTSPIQPEHDQQFHVINGIKNVFFCVFLNTKFPASRVVPSSVHAVMAAEIRVLCTVITMGMM